MKAEGNHKQEELMEKDTDEASGKVTRSGRIIGPVNKGSRPGEAQVSPGTT